MEKVDTKTETTLGLFVKQIDGSYGKAKLIVYNDDINTFDHVIECFITICNLTKKLAEIKALTIHTDGKCKILTSDINDVITMCDSLKMKGLKAELEKIKE